MLGTDTQCAASLALLFCGCVRSLTERYGITLLIVISGVNTPQVVAVPMVTVQRIACLGAIIIVIVGRYTTVVTEGGHIVDGSVDGVSATMFKKPLVEEGELVKRAVRIN
jgi:hypothetical protein